MQLGRHAWVCQLVSAHPFCQEFDGCSLTSGRPWPIMLKVLPIMLLSSAQKIAHYAQYYAHKY